MSRRDIVIWVILLDAVWLGAMLQPDWISWVVALNASVTFGAYALVRFVIDRRARSRVAETQVSGDPTRPIRFPVSRRIMRSLGWALWGMGFAGFVLIGIEGVANTELKMVLATFLLCSMGLFFLKGGRNVREIEVNGQEVRFLPVGAAVPLGEVAALRPAQAGKAASLIELDMKSPRGRYIPGAILQWKTGCKLNVVGSDAAAVRAALEQRVSGR